MKEQDLRIAITAYLQIEPESKEVQLDYLKRILTDIYHEDKIADLTPAQQEDLYNYLTDFIFSCKKQEIQ